MSQQYLQDLLTFINWQGFFSSTCRHHRHQDQKQKQPLCLSGKPFFLCHVKLSEMISGSCIGLERTRSPCEDGSTKQRIVQMPLSLTGNYVCGNFNKPLLCKNRTKTSDAVEPTNYFYTPVRGGEASQIVRLGSTRELRFGWESMLPATQESHVDFV